MHGRSGRLTRLVMHDGRPDRSNRPGRPTQTLPSHQEKTMTDQTAERDQYARAIREAVRIRLGTNALRLAEEGRPVMLNMSEAEAAADAVLAVRDAARQAAGHSCGNCEGIDPGTCLANPGRQAAGQTPTTELGICINCEHRLDHHGDEVCGQPLRLHAGNATCGCTWSDDDQPAPVAEQPAEAQPAEVPLTPAERQFLTFALELAADQMYSRGDEFEDDDHAALARLRRMTVEETR